MARTYEYPQQPTKLRPGSKASIQDENGSIRSLTVEAIDKTDCRVTLKIGTANSALLTDKLNLHPDTPIDTSTTRYRSTFRTIATIHSARRYLR